MPGDIFKARKVIVLGSRGAGKTGLISQYIDSTFFESYSPTIYDYYIKEILYNNVTYKCKLLDTAGTDTFSILSLAHVIGIHGFMFVYSVTSRESFEMVKINYDKILDISGFSSLPAVIVGQKSDLCRREVTPEEGKSLADSITCAFVETSARNNVNIDKAFELCMEVMDKKYKLRSVQQPPAKACILM